MRTAAGSLTPGGLQRPAISCSPPDWPQAAGRALLLLCDALLQRLHPGVTAQHLPGARVPLQQPVPLLPMAACGAGRLSAGQDGRA
jgi:hypothetical protein